MLDYPRAALADKLHTHQRKNTERNIKHQLLLQRGHWFETGGHQALMGMASPLCHNWKSRSDTGMCPSKPIWTSHSSPPNLNRNRQYGFWKSNPQQGYRQSFPRATLCRSAVRRRCSKPTGTIRFSTSFRRQGKSSTTGRFLKSVMNALGYPFLMMLQLATFRGGFSVCPYAMRKPLVRFFLKIRMLPDVWIWLPNSGRR